MNDGETDEELMKIKPLGGHRHSHFDREQIIRLVELNHKNPQLTASELIDLGRKTEWSYPTDEFDDRGRPVMRTGSLAGFKSGTTGGDCKP